MMRNFMITLTLCLCTATLFAQPKPNTTAAQRVLTGRQTSYIHNKSGDDLYRKSAGELMDSIRNSPKWKTEIAGISAEFYNSAAWKKSKEDAAMALPLWDTHSTTGNKAWQDAVGKSNAELENSGPYKTYQAKSKDFNKRLDQETMRQLYKDDPRSKTAF